MDIADEDTNGEFTVHDYANWRGAETEEGSAHIQSYLRAQRNETLNTYYMLYRCPGTRTSTARWRCGVKAGDVRRRDRTLVDDIETAIDVWAKDQEQVGRRNPRQVAKVRGKVDVLVTNIIPLIMAALEGGE